MAKILGVIVQYPEGVNVEDAHRELQKTAMKILADSVVKELPPEAVRELIERLEQKE